jgi:D-lactate dehydrogenase
VLERVVLAHDASHFLMFPEEIANAESAKDIGVLIAEAAAQGRSITFRSGGTSLSGQAQSASMLVDTRRSFRTVEVLDEGARVRVQPGATVRSVNVRLAP